MLLITSKQKEKEKEMCRNIKFGIVLDNKTNVITSEMENDLINFLDLNPQTFISIEELGLTEEDINNPDNYTIVGDEKDSIDLAATSIIKLYRYISDSYGASDIGSNSRPFCKEMVSRTKLSLMPMESIVSLNSANPGFGIGGSQSYSVFNWRGGVNCKHYWVKYFYQPDTRNLVKAPQSNQPTQTDKGKVPRYKKK